MMKNIKILIFSILLSLLFIPTCSFLSVEKAYAQDYMYDYFSDSLYEVDHITDSGNFEFVKAFDDFSSAKSFMRQKGSYVVRCKYGYSSTKIVAMNSGLVYSYPRGSSNTQDLYEEWGDNKYNRTISYVERRYEMTYIDTPYMSAKSGFLGQGYVEVMLNGFDGFADVEYTDLVPSKFIDNGLPIYLGGPYSGNSVQPQKVIITPNYYVVNKNGNYFDLEFHYHLDYPDSNGYAKEYTLKVDNGENYTFLNPGTHYFSDDGYNFYSDYRKGTYIGTCYNYYQFLPVRTKTNISSSSFDGFLSYMGHSDSVMMGHGNDFISLGDEYGCNGALIYALACQESAYGTSGYAKNRNNLFGWNAFDDSPDDASYFSSISVAIKEQMGRNLRRYMDYTDSRYNGTYFGNKGSGFNLKYASDPYWGIKIASIYYNLDKYDNNYNGNLTDYNRWQIGLVKNFGASIYSDETCKTKLCGANYTSTRQIANTVNIVEEKNDGYRIQFSNPRNKQTGEVYKNVDGVIGYSWSGSCAYVKKTDVQLLNVIETEKQPENKTDDVNLRYDPFASINLLELDGSMLKISGIGIVTCVDIESSDDIEHNVIFKSFDGTKNYKFAAENTEISFSINDGFNYKNGGFNANIDLSELEKTSYILELEINVGEYNFTTPLTTTSVSYRRNSSISEGVSYFLKTNQYNRYRLELDVEDTPIDYSTINKPYEISSLSAYNTINIDNNGRFIFDGYALIFYLDYNNLSDLDYKLYLINSSENYKTIDVENYELSQGIIDIFHLDNDIKYAAIKFNVDIDELNLESGTYKLLLEISNKSSGSTYIDYVELCNETNRSCFDVNYNDKNYKLVVNPIRHRLDLVVSDIEQEG